MVMISLSLSVDCTPGFGGDDCVTPNTCNEGVICNKTGYCNSEGECICPEGFTHSETGCVEGNVLRVSLSASPKGITPMDGCDSPPQVVKIVVMMVVTFFQ